jgi:putative tryptophan/tyrosine transport system substrate-binding protein
MPCPEPRGEAVRRREFIKVFVGTATAWPLTARAQQPRAVIGFLSSASPDAYSDRLRALRQGLKEVGYVEGQNVQIEYRWAEGRNDQLASLAAELVRQQVAVIVAAGGTPSALAAKAATATIPIVFAIAVDPVEIGLVTSVNRPGGNLTGVTNLNVEIGPKRLELLHELVPAATTVTVLVDPTSPTLSEAFLSGLQTAAPTLGMQLEVLRASTEAEIETAFVTLQRRRAPVLVIGPSTFFNARTEKLAALSLSHGVPTIYQFRPFVAAGGLVSYGSDETEFYRLVGVYAGKILNGDKPANLPVQQTTTVELIVNLKTAKALGITVPQSVQSRADEVIE